MPSTNGFKISRSYLDSAAAPAPKASRGAGLMKGSSGRNKALMSAGITTGTAFGFGYLEGKNLLTIPGAPAWLGADLIAGAVLQGAVYFAGNKLGKYASYVADAGTGAMANWASYMGLALAKTGSFGGARIAGAEGYPTLGQNAQQIYQGQYQPQGQYVGGQQF